jgi:hypothetical protein
LHSKGYQVRRRPSVTMNDQNHVQRINLIEFLGRPCPFRVKIRRTHYEHMFSALPLNSDIARCSRHFAFVPTAEVATLQSITASATASTESGMVTPSSLEVLRFLTRL